MSSFAMFVVLLDTDVFFCYVCCSNEHGRLLLLCSLLLWPQTSTFALFLCCYGHGRLLLLCFFVVIDMDVFVCVVSFIVD